MELPLTGAEPVDALLDAFPSAGNWLRDHGVICTQCGETYWGPLRERLFLHNVLRVWMDRRDQQQLNGSVAVALREAEPRDWLPFVGDEHLRAWRDWLVEQLSPGQCMQTAEVFARRMGVSAVEMEAVSRSPQQMQERVFCHVPRAALQSFHDIGYERSVVLVNWYLGKLVGGTL